MSVRQQLVNAVEAKLKGVKKAAGYSTDVGNKVWVCRPVHPTDAEAETGAVNIWDLREESRTLLNKVQEHKLEIHVYVVYTGSDAASFVRKVVADIAKAVGSGAIERWGGLATNTEPVSNQYELDQEKRLTGAIQFIFKVIYQTPSWDFCTVA